MMNLNLDTLTIFKLALDIVTIIILIINIVLYTKLRKTNKEIKKSANDIEKRINDIKETPKDKVENWKNEEIIKERIQACKPNTFKELDELIKYIDDGKVDIVDVINEKICVIVKIEKCTYNGNKTVRMTFSDDTAGVFFPDSYAPYNIE